MSVYTDLLTKTGRTGDPWNYYKSVFEDPVVAVGLNDYTLKMIGWDSGRSIDHGPKPGTYTIPAAFGDILFVVCNAFPDDFVHLIRKAPDAAPPYYQWDPKTYTWATNTTNTLTFTSNAAPSGSNLNDYLIGDVKDWTVTFDYKPVIKGRGAGGNK